MNGQAKHAYSLPSQVFRMNDFILIFDVTLFFWYENENYSQLLK